MKNEKFLPTYNFNIDFQFTLPADQPIPTHNEDLAKLLRNMYEVLKIYLNLRYCPIDFFTNQHTHCSFEKGGPIVDRSTFFFLQARQLAFCIIPYKNEQGQLTSILQEEIEKAKKLNKFYPYKRIEIRISSFPSSRMPDNSHLYDPTPQEDSIERHWQEEVISNNFAAVFFSHLQFFLYKHDKEIKEFYKEVEEVYFTHDTNLQEREGDEPEDSKAQENIIYSTKIPLEEVKDLDLYNKDYSIVSKKVVLWKNEKNEL